MPTVYLYKVVPTLFKDEEPRFDIEKIYKNQQDRLAAIQGNMIASSGFYRPIIGEVGTTKYIYASYILSIKQKQKFVKIDENDELDYSESTLTSFEHVPILVMENGMVGIMSEETGVKRDLLLTFGEDWDLKSYKFSSELIELIHNTENVKDVSLSPKGLHDNTENIRYTMKNPDRSSTSDVGQRYKDKSDITRIKYVHDRFPDKLLNVTVKVGGAIVVTGLKNESSASIGETIALLVNELINQNEQRRPPEYEYSLF